MTRDHNALAQLFEDGAVLVAGNGPHARGAGEITRLVASIWKDGRTYVAEPLQILQARDTALVIAKRGVKSCAEEATAAGATPSRCWFSAT